MSGGDTAALQAHLETGVTTICRAWALTRTDGVRYGFTDHDCDLGFEGMTFKADTGLTAKALQQSTGLSVDNSEAMGALSDAAVREEDIEAGRFDGAELTSWVVNWADVGQRKLMFRGTLGEIRRTDGAFHAELRGLTEALNRPTGRAFQKPCTAVLGDGACRVDLNAAGYSGIRDVESVEDARVFRWDTFLGFEPGWFQRGRLVVLSGPAAGLRGSIKRDVVEAGQRRIELWSPIRATVSPGDTVRVEAGCDKRFQTCRLKFNNVVNYQGFPDIPGEDWMMSVPKRSGANTGGSRR